jgi:hypothetical protein
MEGSRDNLPTPSVSLFLPYRGNLFEWNNDPSGLPFEINLRFVYFDEFASVCYVIR